MGKTSRWFRSLLGGKKQPSDSAAADPHSANAKKEKGYGRSSNKGSSSVKGSSSFADASSSSRVASMIDGNFLDPSKHAIAVAAATAAVAEAAIAAAQAAAEVVRLTSGGSRAATPHAARGGGEHRRRESAAVKIQSAFRAYLARRALRALKGLVKLQALVRGHIVRKQSADMLRRMQAMVRIQARACASRAYVPEYSYSSSSKSFQAHHPGIATPMKHDHQFRAHSNKFDDHVLERCGSKPNFGSNVNAERMNTNWNWLDRWMEETSWSRQRDKLLRNGRAEDEKADKILEIDTWKPHFSSKRNERAFQTSQHAASWQNNKQVYTAFEETLPRHSTKLPQSNPVLLSEDVSSVRSIKLTSEMEQGAVWTAEDSSRVHSTSSRPGSNSSRRGPFTPARSECARSFFGDYLSHPSYMSNTESSRAKMRSQSAPRQRIPFEKPGSTRRYVPVLWDPETASERGSSPHSNFRSKVYSGSGNLDRPGTPIRDAVRRNSSIYDGRY